MARKIAEIQGDIEAMDKLDHDYRAYYGVKTSAGAIVIIDIERDELRRKISRQLGRVERIMNRAGTNGFGISPPAMVGGGPPLAGIVACAFVDDHPMFQSGPPFYEVVLDRIALTLGELETELGTAESARGGSLGVFLRGVRSAFADSRAAFAERHPRARAPRLIVGRLLKSPPTWVTAVERIVLFAAAVAAIVLALAQL